MLLKLNVGVLLKKVLLLGNVINIIRGYFLSPYYLNGEFMRDIKIMIHGRKTPSGMDAGKEYYVGKKYLENLESANRYDIEILENSESKPKRARNAKGQLKADDPSTPDVNEAYEGGKGPKKKKKKKK